MVLWRALMGAVDEGGPDIHAKPGGPHQIRGWRLRADLFCRHVAVSLDGQGRRHAQRLHVCATRETRLGYSCFNSSSMVTMSTSPEQP